jgi:hypothetical protein
VLNNTSVNGTKYVFAIPATSRAHMPGAGKESRKENKTDECKQTPKSKILLYPYYAILWGGFAGMSFFGGVSETVVR